jgi:GMP synthase (glutamine-hydrolysing)
MQDLNIPFEHHVYFDISLENLGKYSSVILSGRRKNNSQMNAVNSKLVRHCLEKDKSLLGVCYGAEILALTLGGTIHKMSSSRHGLYDVMVSTNNPLCSGKINAFESHSYMVSKLGAGFVPLAFSSDCKFEIFRYSEKNIFGTQFHPEMSPDGKSLLEKFSLLK